MNDLFHNNLKVDNFDKVIINMDMKDDIRDFKKIFLINKVKRIYRCKVCGKLFRENGNLKIHQRIHTGEKPYKCHYEGCNKEFISLGNMKSHEFNHTEEKPYKCTFNGCNKYYSRQFRLEIHIRTHTGEKPFECLMCMKTFNEKGNLRTHMRIHTGEKPYKCNFEGCNQTFRAHSHLKDHRNTHLKVKQYTCKICEKNFGRSSTLKVHLKTHNEDDIKSIVSPHNCSSSVSPINLKNSNEIKNSRNKLKINNGPSDIYDKKGVISLKNMDDDDITENESDEEKYCNTNTYDFGFEQPEIKRFGKLENKSLFDRINNFSKNNDNTSKIANIRQFKDNISFSHFAQPITPVSHTKKIIKQHSDNQKITREEINIILNKIEPYANKSTDNPNNYQKVYSQIKQLFDNSTDITKLKLNEILNSYDNMYENNIYNNNFFRSMFMSNSPARTPNTGSETCKNHIEGVTPNHYISGLCNLMIDNSPYLTDFNNCLNILANSPSLNIQSPMNAFMNSPFNTGDQMSNRLNNLNFTDLVKNLGYKTNY